MSLPGLSLVEVVDVLRGLGVSRVLLQCAPGLRGDVLDSWCDFLGERGVDVVVSGSSCWGPCDVAVDECRLFGCDAVLHVGHWWFGCEGGVQVVWLGDVPVVFAPYFYDLDVGACCEDVVEVVRDRGFRRVLVCCTQQYYPLARYLVSVLRSCGVDVVCDRVTYLGCEVVNLRQFRGSIDCVVAVSGGYFLGVGFFCVFDGDVPVIQYDPHSRRFLDVSSVVRRLIGIKLSRLVDLLSRGFKRVGVVVSRKFGQCRFALAVRVRDFLRSRLRGVRVDLLVFDDVPLEVLDELPYDVYVNTACPRLGLDDVDRLRFKVLLNLGEVKYLVSRSVSGYRFSDVFGVPSWLVG